MAVPLQRRSSARPDRSQASSARPANHSETPNDVARQGGAKDEFEVTPDMIEAGKAVFVESGLIDFGVSGSALGCEGGVVADIYRAMRTLEKPA